MARDKTENHEKIMAAAYDEFMKYGFADASMRRIATACGMSASGLYKHFPSKEEMFAALVEPAYEGLKKAYGSEETPQIMNYIYDNFEAFRLLVCRSRGTRLENFVNELARKEEDNTRRYMGKLSIIGAKVTIISDKELHMMVTTCINAIFLAVENDLSREEAIGYARHIDEFNKAGWDRMFRLKK